MLLEFVKHPLLDQIPSFANRYSRRIAVILVLLVLLLSIGINLASGNALRYPDEREYNDLAKSILSGRGYRNTAGEFVAYRAPGWPILLSGVYAFWDNPLAGKLLNSVLLGAAIWIVSRMIARVSASASAIAPLLLVFYPVEFYVASTLYPQTLGAFLFVAVLWLFTVRNLSRGKAVLAGVLMGLLVLTIPSFLLVMPLFLLGRFLFDRHKPGRFAYHAILFVVTAFVVLAPWTIRNAWRFNRFVPVASSSGYNLLLGNCENARVNSGVNVDVSRYTDQTQGMDEAEADAYLRAQALNWILSNPYHTLQLYFGKLANYFNFRNELYVKSEATRLRDVVMFMTYYPLLLIAVIRLLFWRFVPILHQEGFFYILYFGNAFVSAIFITRIRYRLPFDLLLIGIAAIALGRVAKQCQGMKIRLQRSEGRGASSP